MVEGKKLGLVGKIVLAAGAVGGLVGGCSDYGNAVSQGVGEYALMESVAGAVRNEVEGPRGTTVNVGGGGGDNDSRQSVRDEKPESYKPRLLVNKCKDFNNDGKLQRKNEILGPVDNLINLDRVGLMIRLSATMPGNTTYSLVDSDYNRLADISVSSSVERTMYAFSDSASNSFMETVRKLEPGKYIIHVRLASRSFLKEIMVVRDSSVKDITDVFQ